VTDLLSGIDDLLSRNGVFTHARDLMVPTRLVKEPDKNVVVLTQEVSLKESVAVPPAEASRRTHGFVHLSSDGRPFHKERSRKGASLK